MTLPAPPPPPGLPDTRGGRLPDSLQVSQDHFIATKPRGQGPDPLAGYGGRVAPLDVLE